MPLGDRTLIERVLGWLASEHVGQVVLNLHHLPESICGIVGDGAHLGLRARYSWESPLLGSAGGPRHALPLLESDEFLMVNGDTLCPASIADLVAAHRAQDADVTMAVVPNPDRAHYNGIVMATDGRITGFVPRGHRIDSWHFVGIQVVKSSVFASLPDNVPAETVSGIYRDRIAAGSARIFAIPVPAPFSDIGTARDYLAAATALEPDADVVATDARVSPEARVHHSIVWPGTTIEAGASIERCVVAGVHVPGGFHAADSVIVPAGVTRAGDGARISDGVAVFPIA